MTSRGSMGRGTLAVLATPTLGLSLAVTIVAAFVPLLVRDYTTSNTVAGLIVGGEGLMALFLPLLLGTLSDRTRTRLGSRLPYVLAGAPLATGALAALPFAPSLWTLATLVGLFYVGYYVCYTPYRALFPDLVPRRQLARSQGVQTIFREIGLGLALAGGPLLVAAWEPLAFVLGAVALAGTTALFVVRIRRRACDAAASEDPPEDAGAGGRAHARPLLQVLREHRDVRRVLVANALWELALGALRAFVVLYVVVGLGRSNLSASALLGAVAAVAVVAAPVAGFLGDRFGTVRVMRVALLVYGAGLLLPAFTRSIWVLAPALPLIGFGGAVAMTLPYALVAERQPRRSHGAASGLYDLSRGLGVLAGPVLAGAAVDLARPWMADTRGYGAVWIVAGSSVLVSLPLLSGITSPARTSSPGSSAEQEA